MTRTEPGIGTIPLLPLVGFVSGFLTVLANRLSPFTGWVFGLAVSAYCWHFLRHRSLWKIAAFVAASTVALAAAYFSFFFPVSMPALDFSGGKFGMLPTDNFLTCGVVGALIVLTAAVILLFPIRKPSIAVLSCVIGSLLGGGLGLAGWMLGPSLGQALVSALHLTPSEHDPFETSLCVVWQTGMGLLLGLTLWLQRAAVKVPPLPPNPPVIPRSQDKCGAGTPARAPRPAEMLTASNVLTRLPRLSRLAEWKCTFAPKLNPASRN